jgi:hypothetical protein
MPHLQITILWEKMLNKRMSGGSLEGRELVLAQRRGIFLSETKRKMWGANEDVEL